MQQRIVANYRGLGVDVVAERHLGIRVNHEFAGVEPETLLALMREVASDRPQAITTFCTNLRAAPLARQVERELGIPLLDTVSTDGLGNVARGRRRDGAGDRLGGAVPMDLNSGRSGSPR